MLPTISSVHNPKVKEVMRLAKRRERDAARLTVVEGVREVEMALAAGLIPAAGFVLDAPKALVAHIQQTGAPLYQVTPEVYAKLAYREASGGILIIVPYPTATLDTLALPANPFVVVIEGVEKPGNLGAILRTADAAGVDAVLVCTGATDLFNPNAIRASLGAIFALPVVEVTTDAALAWLAQHGIRVVATSPQANVVYTKANLRGPVAVVMGSEAQGLTPAWLNAADMRVTIPMAGKVDSLNLSVSAALLIYEVVRQRAG